MAAGYLRRIGCASDFERLASLPLDISIPGARSVKFVVDTRDNDNLYFQDSQKYKVHWEFVSMNLSGKGKPVVPALGQFNQTEYYAQSRRFLLGAVTHYQGPNVYVVEFAPYDTASADMMARAHRLISAATFFGKELAFHPTSEAIERESAKLPKTIPIKTTRDLFEKVEFVPLNAATSIGLLRFVSVAELETSCVGFRDIVVLDRVPNDLSVTMGIVTEEFQTPLSHINVLARNRKIPNLWVKDAFSNPRLRALANKWVRLAVTVRGYTIEEVDAAAAEAWWQAHRPPPLEIPKADLSKTGLPDVTSIIDRSRDLRSTLKEAILAYGGKATHYAAMAGADLVPMPGPKGFVIPVFYYDQFMQMNGFYTKIDALLADPSFMTADCKQREVRLKALRKEMEVAPVDPAFEQMLAQKLTGYPGTAIRFRSSSTAEDVGGFTGAGLYTSKTGDVRLPEKQPLEAIRKVWSSVWYQRGFEERAYRQVNQRSVGMAILAHPNFATETASGVAQTANSYDPSGLQPAFVINVQKDNGSVTLPEPGTTTEQIIYYYQSPNQPIEYVQRSNKVPAGSTVLTRAQVFALGQALDKIHEFFRPAYGPPIDDPQAWYALEVDFKFDVRKGENAPSLFIKQARPLPPPFSTEDP
ncbi:MAG TPA: PEP/pyruvate-binding domain-containing protein [Polyangia bacterium]